MLQSLITNSTIDKISLRYSICLSNYSLPINKNLIGLGEMAYVITSENERQFQTMPLGFTPFWAKERMNLLTARAEGDKNPGNDPFYNGPNSIFLKPAFKKSVQHYRCLVIVDGYIDHSSQQEIIVSTNEQPAVFAGIYDYWKDPVTKIVNPGFAIITVPTTGIIRSSGIPRMPVILSYYNCLNWVRSSKPLSYYLPLLNRSGIEIANDFKIGNTNKSEASIQGTRLPVRYRSKRDQRPTNDGPTWGEKHSKTNL